MKKRICFYINTFVVGGIEKVLIELLKNIDKNKFEVTLLIGFKLDEMEKLKSELPKDIKVEYLLQDDFFCKIKKKKSMGKIKKFEKIFGESFSWLRKIIFRKKLFEKIRNMDVIIDFDMTLAPYAKNIKNKIITFCHLSPKNYHRGIKSRQKKHGERLNDYDKVIMISDEMKQEALEMYPFLKEKLLRVYNSFDIERIVKMSEEKIEDKRIEDKYILAIGRLEETQKDFTTLIKSYALVEKKVQEKLFIIGEGRHKEELIKLVNDLDLEEKIIFLGFKKNPYPWLKKASLFIHSSKFEGLPTVVIEALILRKLIIATDCPTGPKEILDNGKNGILTEVGNKREMAEAIEKILIKRDENENYLRNSLDKIKEFDSKNVMKEVEKILIEV